MSDGKEGLLAHGIAAVEVYGIASVDRDGRVLTWNRGAERLSGYSPAEVLGRSIGVIFASRDGEDAGFQLEAVAQESAEYGVWIRGPHGKDRQVAGLPAFEPMVRGAPDQESA